MTSVLFGPALALGVLALTIALGVAVCRRTRDRGLWLLLLGLILQLTGALAGRVSYSTSESVAPVLGQVAF
jgi:hypothetical protein